MTNDYYLCFLCHHLTRQVQEVIPHVQVFKRAVREVKAGQTALEAGEGRGGDSTYFNRTIVILLHLVCLLTKLIPHLEKEKVGQIL